MANLTWAELRADIIALRRTGRSQHPDPTVRADREARHQLAQPTTGPVQPSTPETRARAAALLRRCQQR